MPCCCVPGCNNRSSNKGKIQLLLEMKKKISFHKIPMELKRRKVWAEAIRTGWIPTDKSVVCSIHFDDKCFDRTSQSSIRLHYTAVPTLLLSQKIGTARIKSCKKPLKRTFVENSLIQIKEEPQQSSEFFPNSSCRLPTNEAKFSKRPRRELSPTQTETPNEINEIRLPIQAVYIVSSGSPKYEFEM